MLRIYTFGKHFFYYLCNAPYLVSMTHHIVYYIKSAFILFFWKNEKIRMLDEYSLRFLLHDNDVYVIGIWIRDMVIKIFDVWSWKFMMRIKCLGNAVFS